MKEASRENILKQDTIDNLESKQQKVNQHIQKFNAKINSLKTDLKNSKANNSNKNDESTAELLEEGITIIKSENTTELERKKNELEQINISLKDNSNKIDETLNIKTNELGKTLQDLKSQKEKSESGNKDFQNKLKILKEGRTISETKTINYMKH